MKPRSSDIFRRYQEVAKIGQEINHELSTPADLFQKLHKHIARVLDTSDAFLLAIYQPQTNTIDTYLEDDGKFSVKQNDPVAGAYKHIIETKKTLLVQQMSKEIHHLPFQYTQMSIEFGSKESVILVPLVFRNIPLGVLSIQHKTPNTYDQEDLSILQLLANHIALALHNIRLYNNLSRLNDIGQLLTQQLASDKVLQATVDKIREATKADIIVLYPYEPTTQQFVVPPRIAGTLYASSIESMSPRHSDDVASLTLNHVEPIFSKETSTLYTTLYTTLDKKLRIRKGSFHAREGIQSTAAMPLSVGDISVGVLFVNFRQAQRFDASQKLLIEGLAHYAAIAINNAQDFERLSQRRIHELEILRQMDRELTRNLDLGTVLHTMLTLTNKYIPADEASVLLYHPRSSLLITEAAIGRHTKISLSQAIPLQSSKGITRWVWENKMPVRIANIHHEHFWKDLYIPVADDIISELDVPLLDGEEIIGVVNFESTKEGAFRQEDQDFLQTLAGQAVLAIKNAQAYEREKRLAAEAQVLNDISKEITSQLDYVQIFELILEKALELTHSNLGSLILYNIENNDLWIAAERGAVEGKKDTRLRLDQGIVGYVARHKQILNIDPTQPPWKEIYLDFFPGARSELAVPMQVGNELIGVLNVESPLLNNFKERDIRLLGGLADLAVIALQNAQAYEREKRLVVESQIFDQISQEITRRQLDRDRVFNLILEKALELTDSTTGTLEVYNPEWNDLEMRAEQGVTEGRKHQRLILDKGVVGYVARHKQMLNVDPSQPPWNELYVPSIPGTRSELAVPMLEGNELRGVLNVESKKPNRFKERDIRLLQGLSQLAVVALQNTEHHEQAESMAQRFEWLYKAAQELGKITEFSQIEQAYDIILTILQKYCNGHIVISRYEGDMQELEVTRTTHQPDHILALHEKNTRQLLSADHAILVYDLKNLAPDITLTDHPPTELRALVAVTIEFKERYYGNLEISHEEVGHYVKDDIHFLQGLTLQLASTMYRLETVKARQDFERISSIGRSTFELTHRLANDLALVPFYTSDIQWQMKETGITDALIDEKLNEIVKSVQGVLTFSDKLKRALINPSMKEDLVLVPPQELFNEVTTTPSLPPTIRISQKIENEVEPIRINRSQIIDILRNLITNAIEAMPEGGEISLYARNSNSFVALEVQDTGIGIPPQHKTKIFELNFSTKGSSGFGLWSARHNTVLSGGDLKVESQPGCTTFTLLLPRNDGENT